MKMDMECIRIWDVRYASLRVFRCDRFSRLQEMISDTVGIQPPDQLILVQNTKLDKNNFRQYSSVTMYLFSMDVKDSSQPEMKEKLLNSTMTSDPDDLDGYSKEVHEILTNAGSMLKRFVEGRGALKCFADDERKMVDLKVQDTQLIFIQCLKRVDFLLKTFEFALSCKLMGSGNYGDLLTELWEVQKKYSYFLKQCETHGEELTKCRKHPDEDSKEKEGFKLFEKHRVEAENKMAHFERLKVLSTRKLDIEMLLLDNLKKINSDLEEIYSRSFDTNSFEIQNISAIWNIGKQVDKLFEAKTQLTKTVDRCEGYLQRQTLMKSCLLKRYI